MGFIYGMIYIHIIYIYIYIILAGNLPKTYFPTSWLRQQSDNWGEIVSGRLCAQPRLSICCCLREWRHNSLASAMGCHSCWSGPASDADEVGQPPSNFVNPRAIDWFPLSSPNKNWDGEIVIHGNGRYCDYTNLVLRCRIEKWKHFSASQIS